MLFRLRQLLTVLRVQRLAQTDGDDPFKELSEELSRLREINPTEYEMTSDEFLGLDDNVCTTEEHPIIDEEILSSLVSNADDDDGGEKDNDVCGRKRCTTKPANNRRIRGSN